MVGGHAGRGGLRERKKQRTREALSLAAIRLAVERGWAAVTVEDIAAAADVSVRTFRNYFSGKAEAVAARHLDRMRRIADELRVRPGDEPLWEALVSSVEAQFAPDEDLDAVPAPDPAQVDGVRVMLTEPALQGELARAHALAQDELAAAIAERTGTDPARDLYPALVAAAAGSAVAVAIEHCLRAEAPTPLGPVLRDALEQLRAGLPVP
ncbi:TetR/AcrR family transcriptional regulator [Pseudonocardia asaccharolytica]|uniref:TetR family transcriptional regulator n=1 Tax=Pseudonocardia asaccharolytica DSM 44247 = NBRC 16224 TaxID=1123024 RepID=A0A511CXK9_9PSEU|nr:TetR family transcriptional regulator [Pseudonocardia asaccharolytica]GEL17291.1 TetR family transcriptional regulator [Pseudonocardia asaccharolytica DSM 44247 = NBRC 16224]